MTSRINSEVRGPGLISPAARLEYRSLAVGQPLVLTREPTNPVDPNAVIAMTVLLQPCGYIAKEHAKVIAPQMDAGVLWLCKVTHPGNAMRCPQVVLWKERGQAQKFKDIAMAYGASERTADAIVQKKFLSRTRN